MRLLNQTGIERVCHSLMINSCRAERTIAKVPSRGVRFETLAETYLERLRNPHVGALVYELAGTLNWNWILLNCQWLEGICEYTSFEGSVNIASEKSIGLSANSNSLQPFQPSRSMSRTIDHQSSEVSIGSQSVHNELPVLIYM